MKEELTRNEKSQVFSKELNPFARFRPFDFVGRVDIINEIHNKFNNNSLVLLQGVGGIGKTALGKCYLEVFQHEYDHLAYIDVTESLYSSLFKKLGSIVPDFVYDYDESTSTNLYNLINKLHLIKNTLLVIDNANDESELRQLKGELESLKWKVLITSRSLPSTYKNETIIVPPLLDKEAKSLFINNYRDLNQEEIAIVERILFKIKYHTKLLIILAKAAFNNPLLKLEEMADQVSRDAYKDDKLNVLVALDKEEHFVYEFLLLLFKPETLNSDQKRYLIYFSILPNQEISVEHLVRIFEKNEKQGFFINIINKLTEKGWIERYDNYYRIHPLIQLVTKEKLYITVVNCSALIDNVISYLQHSDDFTQNAPYLSYGDSLLGYFKDEDALKIGKLANYSSILHHRLYNNNMALGYSSKAIRIFEIDRKSIEWLAQAYGNRSDILNEMLRFTEAEYFLDSALKTQSQFLKKDDRDIATTYSKFSTLYLNRARNGERDNFKRLAYYYKGIDCVNGAIEIFEKKMLSSRYTSDIQNLCSAYNNLATIYEDLFQIENNKEYLDLHFYFDDKALSTAVKFFGDNHISTAYIYNNNGLNYLKSGNTEQAKIYIEKAYVIRKNSLPEDHPDIGVSLYNLARVYEEMRQKNHAITLLEESIEILEKVNHSALASVIRFYNEIR